MRLTEGFYKSCFKRIFMGHPEKNYYFCPAWCLTMSAIYRWNVNESLLFFIHFSRAGCKISFQFLKDHIAAFVGVYGPEDSDTELLLLRFL